MTRFSSLGKKLQVLIVLGGEYTDNLEKHRKVALKHLRFKSEERQTLMERQVPWGECLLPAGQAGPTALRAQDGHQGLALPPPSSSLCSPAGVFGRRLSSGGPFSDGECSRELLSKPSTVLRACPSGRLSTAQGRPHRKALCCHRSKSELGGAGKSREAQGWCFLLCCNGCDCS